MLEDLLIDCPYCGEQFGTLLDTSAAEGDMHGSTMLDYWEDCAVCCRPIRLCCQLADDGSIERLDVLTDDDV